MADPIYKQFALRRTVFYVLIAVISCVFPGLSRAETNPAYTVEGVEVDVTDANAVKAREKALDEVQVKAYRMLAERLIGAEAAGAQVPPDPITASSMVQDFEVMKEQVSTTRYKGIYTVRFRPAAVRSYMAARGKSYSDVAQKPVMVLPYFEANGASQLWGEGNPWMRAWRASANTAGMKPVAVPLGDAGDMQEIGDDSPQSIDPMSVQRLAQRYSAEEVAILVASLTPTPTSQGRVSVDIYNNTFDGPVLVQKVSAEQMAGESADIAFTRAVEKVKEVLRRQDWQMASAYDASAPQQPSIPPAPVPVAPPVAQQPYVGRDPQYGVVPYTRPALGPATRYAAVVRFSSAQEWVRLKNTLDSLYGMQGVWVKTLKTREAALDMQYAGNARALQLALQNAGVAMQPGAGGSIVLVPGGTAYNNVYTRPY